MKTINVSVWDCLTGENDIVRYWTVDETDSVAVDAAMSQARALVLGLIASDHATDHVPMLSEA